MICSPLTAIPVFLNLTQGKSKERRSKIALILGIAVGLILIAGTWFGGTFLQILGIRIAAFQCTGGIVVFLLGLSMLNAQVSPMRQAEDDEARSSIPIVPLAIPVMAGPGGLSAAIVAAKTYSSLSDWLILSVCGAAVGFASYLVLYFGIQLERKLGPSGMNIVTRIGGLIITALAVEMFVRGIEELFMQI
jgi:multiple antibiotic resistance protein